MLQIFFRLRDDDWNRFEPFPQVWNPLLRRREIAGHQEIKAVSETLVINERVPFRFAQFLELENFIVDVVAQNSDIDLVRSGKLREVVKLLERFSNLFGIGQQA